MEWLGYFPVSTRWVHLSGLDGGTPCHNWIGYVPPSGLDGDILNQEWMGYTLFGLDGIPTCQKIVRQSSYIADSMPLALMQEDFLVLIVNKKWVNEAFSNVTCCCEHENPYPIKIDS